MLVSPLSPDRKSPAPFLPPARLCSSSSLEGEQCQQQQQAEDEEEKPAMGPPTAAGASPSGSSWPSPCPRSEALWRVLPQWINRITAASSAAAQQQQPPIDRHKTAAVL